MRERLCIGLVLCGLLLWTVGDNQRRFLQTWQATPGRATFGAFEGARAVTPLRSSQGFARIAAPAQATEVPRAPPLQVSVQEAAQLGERGEQRGVLKPSPLPEAVAAKATTGILALMYAFTHPPTDRKGWIDFSDRVLGLNGWVWLLFGLSFVLLPGEMAAQVALFEGVPSGVELNSVAAATDYRASIGGIQAGAGLYLLTMLMGQKKHRPEVQQVSRYHAMSLCLFVWSGIVLARGVGLWCDGFSWYNLMALISAEGPLLVVTLAGWMRLQIDDDGLMAPEEGADLEDLQF